MTLSKDKKASHRSQDNSEQELPTTTEERVDSTTSIEDDEVTFEDDEDSAPPGRNILSRFRLGRRREETLLRSQKKTRRARRPKRKKRRLHPPTNFKRELYAIPNILTYFRIAMLPLILLVVAHESRWYSFLAGCFFSIACITDFFDGYLARKLNQVTILGKLLDPLADKLIVSSTLIILIPMGRVPDWLVILLLAREFAITGLRGIAASEKMIIASSPLAKYKTAFQMVAIFFLLVHYPYQVELYWLFTIQISYHQVGLAFLYISLFYSLTSAADYFWKFAVQINQRYNDAVEESALLETNKEH